MDRKQAALFYKATLENKNIKADRLIKEFYAARGETDKEIDQIIEEYNAIISEAQKQGHNGKDLVDFLMNNPNKVEYIEKDNDGNVANIKIEGNTVTISGTDGPSETPDLKFGDDSITKPTNTGNLPEFGEGLHIAGEKEPEAANPDDFIFGEGTPSKPTNTGNLPEFGEGLHIAGEKEPETANPDDFIFGEGTPSKPTNTGNLPEFGEGLHIAGEKEPETANPDDFTFGDDSVNNNNNNNDKGPDAPTPPSFGF